MAKPSAGKTTLSEAVVGAILAAMIAGWIVAYGAIWLHALNSPEGLDDTGTETSEKPSE